MMSTDHDLLRKTYQAFNARDLETVLAQMHPMFFGRMAGKVGGLSGHQGIRDYWTRQWAAIDPHVEPVDFATDETGRTVVKVDQVVRDLAGKVISAGRVKHVYQIEEGLIKRMEIRKDG